MKLKKIVVSLFVLSLLPFSVIAPVNAEDTDIIDPLFDEETSIIDPLFDEGTSIIDPLFIVDPLFVPFSDVEDNHENFDAIYFLHKIGFVEGYEVKDADERIFKPDSSINRAEFLTLLLEGTGMSNHETYEECFSDVPTDEWYTTFVCQAKEEGWVDGYSDGTFKPENTINEAEALKILGEVLDWTLAEAKEGEEWYQPYFDYASLKKIVPIEDVATLMSRGDMAEMIFRNIQIVELSLEAYDENLVDELFIEAGISSDEDGDDVIEGDDVVEADDDVEVSDDTEAEDADNVNVELSLDKTSIGADGTDFTKVDIFVTDEAGNPLEDRIVSLTAHTGIDYGLSIFVEEVGEGVYSASFDSKLAGDFSLYATDKESGETDVEQVLTTPGVFDHIEIIDVVYPYENEEHNKALIKVTGKDANENVLPYSSVNNNLGAITTMGTSTVTYDENGIFTIEITADDWGIAYVDIVDKDSSTILSDEEIELFFFPVQLDVPKAVGEDTEQLAVPMHVYFPDSEGRLGTYIFDIYYDPDSLTFIDVEDPFPNDNFPTPSFDIIDEENGVIHLTQTNTDPESSIPEDIPVGTLLFEVTSSLGGSISIDGVVLSDTTGQEKSYLGKFVDVLGGAYDAAEEELDALVGETLDGFWMWWYKIKPTKDVCIDAFIYPGSGATAADVNTDVTNANVIFGKIAQSCNCNFYLNVRVNSVTNLTAAQWTAVDTNGDGDLDATELTPQVTSHPATAGCIPVYYPPAINAGDAGWSWEGSSEGIAMDHSKDGDQRTLAHELAHQLSQGEVKDPNNPPDSATQGADTAGNLMNYNNTGDTLTVGQCNLIESHLP